MIMRELNPTNAFHARHAEVRDFSKEPVGLNDRPLLYVAR